MDFSGIHAAMAATYTSASARRLRETQASLATGLRITSASVDPAGAALASELHGAIDSGRQALSNLGDARSLLDTADGGLSAMQELGTRARELAVQGSSELLGDDGRAAVQAELQQIEQEMARIGSTTEFSGTRLLDGGASSLTVQSGPDAGDTLDLSVQDVTPDGTAADALVSAADFRTYMDDLDTRMQAVSAERAAVGGQQARVDHAASALTERRIAEQAAHSRIADADIAQVSADNASAALQQDIALAVQAQANVGQASLGRLLG